jgi:hypothetical protein
MVSNNAIFARFNKIEAAKASFENVRQIKFAIGDDLADAAQLLNDLVSEGEEISIEISY